MQNTLDDLPVGGGSTANPTSLDEFAQEAPPTGGTQIAEASGPLEVRIVSKNWSTRAQAFEEVGVMFRNAENSNEDCFRDHVSNWKKYLGDANPGSLEKCLDSLILFIDKVDVKLLLPYQNDICKVLIEKCIGHAKPTIKTKGLEAFMLMFEVTEAFDEALDSMQEMLTHKNQKISTCALVTLNAWLSNYGVKKIKIKQFLPLVETMAASTAPAVKQEAINFYKECYKWLGDGLKPIIANLKKSQQDDLEKEYAELKAQPKNIRLTRTDKKKAIDGTIMSQEEEKQDDACLDLFDAADLLKKYNVEWQDKILEIKNWKEKKDLLDELYTDSSVPKIKTGDYIGIAKILKKLMGDANIVVSQTATKCCGSLAKGLRKDFENCTRELFLTLVGQFKKKKTSLDEDVQVVLDNFITYCTTLETLVGDIVTGLADKAPTVKRNICTFIEKNAQVTYIDVLQRASGELINTLTKMSDEPDADVRNSALSVLGILKGRLGDSAMSKFLADLNTQKLEKVNQSADTVKPSKYDKPAEKVAPAPQTKPAAAANKKPAAKPAPVKKESTVVASAQVEDQPMHFDEQPIKPKTNNAFDDQPIGGGKKGTYNFDDLPIGGGPKQDANMEEGEDKPLPKGAYNLDNLDDLDPFGTKGQPAKPRKPAPNRFAQKAAAQEEEKKDGDGDVMMEDVPAPVVARKPAARAPPTTKPSTTAATTTKPAAAKSTTVNVQEEDVGTGLSKEEAEQKVQETFSADIVAKMEDAKWQEKVEGFKQLAQTLQEIQPGFDVIEAVVKFVKSKMKDWKESNLNIIKESLALFLAISTTCEKVNKRSVACMMPYLSDKLGDVKTCATTQEILMNMSELVKPKFVALQIIKYASTAKSPKILQESCNILTRMTDEFGAMNMPLKEMIDYSILSCNHSNPQVRTSAFALFAIMYKHAGETIKNFLKDIKESTMKLIDEEFAKVTPLKKGEFVKKRGFRGEAAVEEVAATAGGKKGQAAGGGGLDDMFPRQDISKQLVPKLMALFKDNNWQKRNEAATKIEEMIRGANMRIQPVGLNDLMDCVKQRINDPNRAVVKAYLHLIGILVEALGPACKQFSKKLLPIIIQCLADRQALTRADVVVAMDKWAEAGGAEILISIGVPLLIQENAELRTEMLKWVLKNKDSIKNTELKEAVKPLVQCLNDRTPAIRALADEVICCYMPMTGFQPFQAATSDLLPAVQNAIKPLLEKIKNKTGASQSAPDGMNGSIGQQKAGQQEPIAAKQEAPKVAATGPTLKKSVQEQIQQQQQQQIQQRPESGRPQIKAKEGAPTLKPEAQQKLNQSINSMQQPLNQSLQLKRNQNSTPVANKMQSGGIPQRSESKDNVKPRGFGTVGGGTMAQFKQEEQQELLNVNFGHKEKRAEFDRKNRFQTDGEIKGDQLDKVKYFTAQALGTNITQKMFSSDFKMHVDCVEMFKALIQAEQIEQIKEILDLIFKWSMTRLADSSNTKFAVTIFDFYATLFQYLEENEYQLWDYEANVIIPLLCDKSGINNNILKDKVKKLLKMIFGLYDKQKCYNLIVQFGLNSKNLRSQSECLDELSEFISRFGIDYSSEKEMKLVAKMADSADKSVRENALKFMGEAYRVLDDNIWRVIGDVTPKVQGLLEGRFKKLKGGLQQSSSQSNFFRPEASLNVNRDQSPNTVKNEGFKTQTAGFGVNRLNQEQQRQQTTTPRSNQQFTKFQQPSNIQQQQKADGANALSKSINQFNSSNKSNEDNKKTPQAGVRKQDMLKKVMSQDGSSTIGGGLLRKPIPQTTRPESSNNLNEVQRYSEPSSNTNKQSQVMRQTQQQVNKQMFYQNDDDDEDLRMFTNDDNFGDPEADKLQDEITKHIHQLKYADLSKRVDSLVSLNEMISAIDQNKTVLIRAANDLVGAFTHVLNDIFDKSVEDIPLRFAKYFITIVLKTCSCKEIMREVNEERIFDLAEQLLTRLLIDNLDKVGDNKEGELILKNLNSSMLRLLENCNHTYIFCVLFNLLRKYKDYPLMPKLPNLIIKCLLKLSKILEKLIDKLDIEKILLAIHEYLVVINHDNKTQNDEMGIRIVKTVTNELVKLKRDNIWEAYRVIQCHNQPDNHICRWIQIILRSLQTQGSSTGGDNSTTGASTSMHNEGEIKIIVEELRNPEKFETAIPKLAKFIEQNPQIELNDYLQECSATFQKFIKTNLDKYRSSQKEESKQQEYGGGMMDSMKSTNNSDNGVQSQPQEEIRINMTSGQGAANQGQSNRISEYQSKLASMKQRNMKSGADTGTNRDNGQQQQNSQQPLNTSFSAMNSSLSQKWHQINQKSSITKRDGLTAGGNVQQMSNTMTGFGGQGNIESKIGKGSQPMNQSIGSCSNSDQNSGGATNQDLNRRLAEMKAKLQALKGKK